MLKKEFHNLDEKYIIISEKMKNLLINLKKISNDSIHKNNVN